MSDLCKDDIAGGNPPNKPTNNPRWCTFNWYQSTTECIVANQTDSEKTELWTGKSQLWRFIDGKIMENPWKSWNSMVHFIGAGFSKSPKHHLRNTKAKLQQFLPMVPAQFPFQWGEKPSDFIPDILVGGWPTPLKNMSSSAGVTIPNIWENKKNVPNHQAASIMGVIPLSWWSRWFKLSPFVLVRFSIPVVCFLIYVAMSGDVLKMGYTHKIAMDTLVLSHHYTYHLVI